MSLRWTGFDMLWFFDTFRESIRVCDFKDDIRSCDYLTLLEKVFVVVIIIWHF